MSRWRFIAWAAAGGVGASLLCHVFDARTVASMLGGALAATLADEWHRHHARERRP